MTYSLEDARAFEGGTAWGPSLLIRWYGRRTQDCVGTWDRVRDRWSSSRVRHVRTSLLVWREPTLIARAGTERLKRWQVDLSEQAEAS